MVGSKYTSDQGKVWGLGKKSHPVKCEPTQLLRELTTIKRSYSPYRSMLSRAVWSHSWWKSATVRTVSDIKELLCVIL